MVVVIGQNADLEHSSTGGDAVDPYGSRLSGTPVDFSPERPLYVLGCYTALTHPVKGVL